MPTLLAAAGAATLVLLSGPAFAQGVATDVLKADIDAVLANMGGAIDRQIKVVDIGKLNVAPGVLHRGPTGNSSEPTTAITHTQVTEVYYVLSGSGTLVTGGAVTEAREVPPDSEIVKVAVGPSTVGQFAEGGLQIRTISEGDIVVIPAGVPHGWREISDHVTYLSIRVDPDRVLPEGYVNPAVTN